MLATTLFCPGRLHTTQHEAPERATSGPSRPRSRDSHRWLRLILPCDSCGIRRCGCWRICRRLRCCFWLCLSRALSEIRLGLAGRHRRICCLRLPQPSRQTSCRNVRPHRTTCRTCGGRTSHQRRPGRAAPHVAHSFLQLSHDRQASPDSNRRTASSSTVTLGCFVMLRNGNGMTAWLEN